MRSGTVIGLVLGLGCATVAVPKRAPGLVETVEPADRVIQQGGASGRGHPRLGAAAEGLLLPAASKWGRTMRMNSVPDLPTDGAPTREYYFHSGRALPRPVWFGCNGPCPPDWSPWPDPQLADGTYERFVANQFGPGQKNPWGLDREVELVRIEVNGGKGVAENGIKLVATQLESLEGKPGYPQSVAALFDAARATFDQFVKQQAGGTAAALAKASSTPHGYLEDPESMTGAGRARRVSDPGPEQALAYEAIVPTWLPDERRLQVLFIRREARLRTASAQHRVGTCGTPSRESWVAVRSGYAVELGQLVELDATGALVRVRSFTPAPMSADSMIEARLVDRTAVQPRMNCPPYGEPHLLGPGPG